MMRENFVITSVEDGKQYWIGRSVATSAFIFKYDSTNKKLYVLTEIRGNGMHDFPGMRCVPCGYVNWGETLPEACSREVFEETGIKINPENWSLCGINSDPNANRENISIHYKVVFYNDINDLSISDERGGEKNEVDKLEWVDVNNLPNDFCFEHDKFIKEYFPQVVSPSMLSNKIVK